MYNFYQEYAGIASLNRLDKPKIERMTNSFLNMWSEAVQFIQANLPNYRNLHVKVRNSLNYYGKESFLKGLSVRTKRLVEDGLFAETSHYMCRLSAEMLENHMWLACAKEGIRFDYTALFQQMANSKTSPRSIFQKAAETLGIEKVSKNEAEEAIDKIKENTIINQKTNPKIWNPPNSTTPAPNTAKFCQNPVGFKNHFSKINISAGKKQSMVIPDITRKDKILFLIFLVSFISFLSILVISLVSFSLHQTL